MCTIVLVNFILQKRHLFLFYFIYFVFFVFLLCKGGDRRIPFFCLSLLSGVEYLKCYILTRIYLYTCIIVIIKIYCNVRFILRQIFVARCADACLLFSFHRPRFFDFE